MALAILKQTGIELPGTSSQGLLALLQEDEPALQTHALRQLLKVVDHYWAEIANSVPLIEAISEDPNFAHRELAAAVASRCFFHLEEYNDALRLALGAGAHFDVSAAPSSRTSAENQYVDTMVAKCIDKYVELRTQDEGDSAIAIDPRMTGIVERMFERCYGDGGKSALLQFLSTTAFGRVCSTSTRTRLCCRVAFSASHFDHRACSLRILNAQPGRTPWELHSRRDDWIKSGSRWPGPLSRRCVADKKTPCYPCDCVNPISTNTHLRLHRRHLWLGCKVYTSCVYARNLCGKATAATLARLSASGTTLLVTNLSVNSFSIYTIFYTPESPHMLPSNLYRSLTRYCLYGRNLLVGAPLPRRPWCNRW
jgi:hypothetical protein